MSISVQNNSSALLALQALNRTNEQLSQVQNNISTTLLVGEAKDNPSVWATAQGQKSDIDSLSAVTASLNRASSVSDVALSSGQSVLDLLNSMKKDVLSAQDNQLTSDARQSLNTDFSGLMKRIQTTIQSASFDGANLLDGSTGNMRFLATADASQVVTLPSRDLSLGGSIVTLSAGSSCSSVATAAAMMAQVDASIANVTSALADIGDQAKLINAHGEMVKNLSNVLTTGRGDLIDADSAADSARLAALQIQQQLGEQSLNIANSMPNILLGLFK